MKIQEKIHIKVFNYTDTKICVESRVRGYTFEPMSDGVPTVEIMSFDEIEYINGKGEIFRSGALRFDESEQEEIFEALRYPDWKKTVITEEDIDDIIFNPTPENQKRVIELKNISTMERIRSRLVKYTNLKRDGISFRIAELINGRFSEMQKGINKSSLVVGEIKEVNTAAEIKNVREQNESLKTELDEMKQMIATLLADKQANTEGEKESELKAESEKKAGRPKKQENKE